MQFGSSQRFRCGAGRLVGPAIKEPDEKRNRNPKVRQRERGQPHQALGDYVADEGSTDASQRGGSQRQESASAQEDVSGNGAHPAVGQDVGSVEQTGSECVITDCGIVHEETNGPRPVTQRWESVGQGGHEWIQDGRNQVDEEGLSVRIVAPFAGQFDGPPDEENGREEMGPEIERLVIGREETVTAISPAGHFRSIAAVNARLPYRFVHLDFPRNWETWANKTKEREKRRTWCHSRTETGRNGQMMDPGTLGRMCKHSLAYLPINHPWFARWGSICSWKSFHGNHWANRSRRLPSDHLTATAGSSWCPIFPSEKKKKTTRI